MLTLNERLMRLHVMFKISPRIDLPNTMAWFEKWAADTSNYDACEYLDEDWVSTLEGHNGLEPG